MHKNETVCRGCFILGNGCGKCSRCLSQRELMVSAQQIFNLTGKMPTLLNAELADAQAEIARLRGALEPHRSGPDFYDWIADRLVHVYGESEGVDFVLTLRRRAQLGREALKDVK